MNKQFLIFLFFVALSTTFWLFNSLGANYEMEFEVPLKLVNVPSKAVVTTDLPKSVHVVVKDRGSVLLQYRYVSSLPSIKVDFEQLEVNNGHVVTFTRDYMKQITRKLSPTSHIVSHKPDTLEYYYNYGEFRRVPVKMQGDIRARERFGISNVRLVPDSVSVYALPDVLDTITAAYTEVQNLEMFDKTQRINAGLLHVRGAKFIPSEIEAEVQVDMITEKTVQVPVQFVNFPATKVLRAFPSKVNVTFKISASKYNSINADNFVMVVSYDELVNDTTGKCDLHLKTIPVGASNVRISPKEIDFLIEDVPSEN